LVKKTLITRSAPRQTWETVRDP